MATDPIRPSRVLCLVVSAAPPARQISELVDLLHDDSWDVHVITTPTAAGWVDSARLAAQTGNPVRHQARRPDEPKSLPKPDAVVIAPATFNTINKWATGVNDSLAMGVLNEALGSRLPIVTAPYAKAALAAHPAFGVHLRFLRDAGVHLTATEEIRPTRDDQPFHWKIVREVLRSIPTTSH